MNIKSYKLTNEKLHWEAVVLINHSFKSSTGETLEEVLKKELNRQPKYKQDDVISSFLLYLANEILDRSLQYKGQSHSTIHPPCAEDLLKRLNHIYPMDWSEGVSLYSFEYPSIPLSDFKVTEIESH